MAKLILHPGGYEAPICIDAESRYRQDELAGKLKGMDANIVFGVIHETRVYIGTMTGRINLKQTGVPNGLIMDGPFYGFFARRIGGQFLLGRPANMPKVGGQTAINFPHINDIKIWEAVLNYLKNEPDTSYEWVNVGEAGDLNIENIILRRAA